MGEHLGPDVLLQALAARLERRQVRRRQRHQKRRVPQVRHEAVGLVQIFQLMVHMKLFLGLIRAEKAQGEGGGLEHANSRRSPGRPARW